MSAYRGCMAPLKNIKRELFAHKIIEAAKTGKSQAWAYEASGYKARGHSAEQLGSQLLKNVEVQRRIAELTAPATRKAKLTASVLMDKFERIEAGATASEQYGAAARAAELQGKLSGLMIDRTEHGGVGEFAQAETIEGVVELLLADTTPSEALAVIDELREQIERVALTRATVVAAAPDRVQKLSIDGPNPSRYKPYNVG